MRVRNLLLGAKKHAIVILASHNREDLTLLSDEILHMEAGRLRQTTHKEC